MKRIKIDDIEENNFYKMPKKIYEFDLKPVDRELYMLCLENWRLSVKNNWINENGEIFFYASQNKLAKQMKVSKPTIISSFKNLISKELLEAEKELGEANMYYLAELNSIEVKKFDQSKNLTGVVKKFDQYQSKNLTGVVKKFDSIKNNTLRINKVRINEQELSSSKANENKKEEQLKICFLFMEKWNKLANECDLSLIKSFTENRKKKLFELLGKYTQEEILETMLKIKNISFLLGRTDKSNWKISFDDFLNEEKFIKILEGAYYDEVKPTGRKQDKRIARQKSAGAKKEYGF